MLTVVTSGGKIPGDFLNLLNTLFYFFKLSGVNCFYITMPMLYLVKDPFP